MNYPQRSLNFRDKSIRRDDNEFWCLTDMWKASGANRHQKPYEWQRQPEVQRFIKAVERQYHAELSINMKPATKSTGARLFPDAVYQTLGNPRATWGHWQVALAYARYLSPEFQIWANDTVRRVLAADPTLVEEMFDRMTVPDQTHTIERLEGKAARQNFTDTLKEHGVLGKGYAQCTEAIQAPILKMPTREAKARRGITKGSIRDVMDTSELAMTRMAEIAAALRIERAKIFGNDNCEKASRRSSVIVRQAFDKIVNGD